MKSRSHNLLGMKFGRWTVLRKVESDKHGNVKWSCRCDCGVEKAVYDMHLKIGTSQSCGCLNKDQKMIHGMYGTPTYNTWCSIIQRCTNPNYHQWKYYGGRSIRIEDLGWFRFESFLSDMGIRPEGKTIDRIDNNKGYRKSNCRWADQTVQNRNSRAAKLNEDRVKEIRVKLASTKYTHQEISELFGISRSNVSMIAGNRSWRY